MKPSIISTLLATLKNFVLFMYAFAIFFFFWFWISIIYIYIYIYILVQDFYSLFGSWFLCISFCHILSFGSKFPWYFYTHFAVWYLPHICFFLIFFLVQNFPGVYLLHVLFFWLKSFLIFPFSILPPWLWTSTTSL